MIEGVFQLNGEYVIETTCFECECTIHSPIGEEEPSELVLKTAFACRRMCEDCLDREDAARAAAKDRQKIDHLFAQSGIPAVICGEDVRALAFAQMLRDGKRADAIDACAAWVDGQAGKPGIYLSGANGVGKTRLAATAAWAWLLRGKPIRWVSVVALMNNLNRAFVDTERRKALAVLTGVDALVLDDLDKVTPSEFVKQQIFAALDARVLAGTPLIVTANVEVGELGARYDDSIMSRLAGHCRQLQLDGPDRRLELDVDEKGT